MNCYLNISNKGVQPQKKFFRRSWQVSHKINHFFTFLAMNSDIIRRPSTIKLFISDGII